jgi:acyl dehydratase/NAD(P)-dependent dehydrogenase (short-subunit alcohol dehydrogenase family)
VRGGFADVSSGRREENVLLSSRRRGAVTRTLCLTQAQVHRFASASGDHNPLHVDEIFARATPYGRCIAHGALVTIAALGGADHHALRHATQLDVQFRQPVFVGETYAVSYTQADSATAGIEVAWAKRVAVAITLRPDPAAGPVPSPPEPEARLNRAPPRHYRFDDLPPVGEPINTAYGCRAEALSALAAEIDAGTVPVGVLSWLAAASYAVGMLVPGRDAVFVGARIRRSSADASGRLTASLSAADDRSGLVVLEAAVKQCRASARMTLHAVLRPPPPVPTRSSIAQYLPASRRLAGRNVLVVGASRGLGAFLSGAFATQQATVWAGFARCLERAETLRREFGTERIRLLQFDGADVDQTQRAFTTVRAQAGSLDGVVLCAAPPLHDSALHPDSSGAVVRFVATSSRLTLIPLAESLQLLAPDGWLVLTSCAALDELPEALPHEAVAKAAMEEAAAYCARHTRARVLVVRVPKIWTDRTNTPLGKVGAAATEQVAATIADRTGREPLAPGLSLLTPEDLLEPPPVR